MMLNKQSLAQTYFNLLTGLDWSDPLLETGLKEGLNKFLSNAFLRSDKRHKYYKGDYYSPAALAKVNAKDLNGLVFEHMVPKQKYIQGPCVEMAKNGTLSVSYITQLLEKYWKIAVITKDEDSLLKTRSMPMDWDQENVFYRYQVVGIELVKSPFE